MQIVANSRKQWAKFIPLSLVMTIQQWEGDNLFRVRFGTRLRAAEEGNLGNGVSEQVESPFGSIKGAPLVILPRE